VDINKMEWPLSKEELEYLYWDKEKSTYEIGDIFGITGQGVWYYKNKYNIPTRRKTNKEFREEVYKLVCDEYTFLEKYINYNTKIKVKHNECGNTYKVTPAAFISQGSRCPFCAYNHKKTPKEYKKEVYNLVGSEYTILGEYKAANDKIKIRHNKCGYEYKTQAQSLISGHGCPKCGYNMMNTNDFKKKVKELVGNEYKVLGEYKGIEAKIKIKHQSCGYIYKVRPSNFIYNDNRCPKCAYGALKTDEEFKKEVYNLWGDEYKIMGIYKKNNIKIKVKHNKCGRIYKTKPSSILSGHGCRRCADKSAGEKLSKTTEWFKEKVYKMVGDRYAVLGKYINNRTKVKIKHNKCGHKYMVRPLSFLYNGSRCPNCKASKGETKIMIFLKNKKIKFKREYTFKGCENIKKLRYDFKIKNKPIVIEYDGKQHFEPIDFFGGEEELKIRKKLDNIKNKYCEENDINLIRIPYWEKDNIEEILEEELMLD